MTNNNEQNTLMLTNHIALNTPTTNALNNPYITPILKIRAEQAGLTHIGQLSSHSLRRGFATSAALAGEPVQTIMRDGRWKSVSIAISYIDQANQVTHHASSKILDTLNGK